MVVGRIEQLTRTAHAIESAPLKVRRVAPETDRQRAMRKLLELVEKFGTYEGASPDWQIARYCIGLPNATVRYEYLAERVTHSAAGTVYFRTEKDCRAAIGEMGSDIQFLFN